MNDKNRLKTHGSPEEELDLYIDSLNQELRPEESEASEAAELQALVRQVRSLRPPPGAQPNFYSTAGRTSYESSSPEPNSKNEYE